MKLSRRLLLPIFWLLWLLSGFVLIGIGYTTTGLCWVVPLYVFTAVKTIHESRREMQYLKDWHQKQLKEIDDRYKREREELQQRKERFFTALDEIKAKAKEQGTKP
jgi:hypothetical protein